MKTGRVNWIQHKNKKILYADYSGLSGEDLMNVFFESKSTQEQAGSGVLIITDFTGANVHSQFVSEIKKAGKELDADMKKGAGVGLSAMHKILYNGYVRFTGQHKKTRIFTTKEEALEWITND